MVKCADNSSQETTSHMRPSTIKQSVVILRYIVTARAPYLSTNPV